MPVSLYTKTYGQRRKAAAAAAITRARATIIASRRAPLRTGGFFGVRKRASRDEQNAIDVDTALYEAITTGSVTLLNGVAQGDDFTNRTGRKITMKSLYIRGVVKNFDTTSGPTLGRMLIVYDKQANAAAPTVADILKEATSTSQFNLNNRDRFSIIMDKQWAVGCIDTTATQSFAAGPICHEYKLYKKLNLDTIFNGTGATIASIATGSIYMVIIGDVTTTQGCYFRLSSRIRFTDK